MMLPSGHDLFIASQNDSFLWQSQKLCFDVIHKWTVKDVFIVRNAGQDFMIQPATISFVGIDNKLYRQCICAIVRKVKGCTASLLPNIGNRWYENILLSLWNCIYRGRGVSASVAVRTQDVGEHRNL